MPPIVSLGRRIDFLFNLCYGVKAFAAAVKNVDFMRVSEFVVITIRTMASVLTAFERLLRTLAFFIQRVDLGRS